MAIQVVFISHDPEGARLRQTAVRRACFVMRRLSWLVPHAKLELSDINGPRGGVDKRCVVELRTQRSGTVVVTSLAREWRAAIEIGLSRAVQALLRRCRRAEARDRKCWPSGFVD